MPVGDIVFIVIFAVILVMVAPTAFDCLKEIIKERRQKKALKKFEKDIAKLVKNAENEGHKMTMEELENLK